MFNISIWGLGFITLGALILINAFFGLNIPVFKILLALLLIYAGVSMLISPPRTQTFFSHTHGWQHSQHVVFNKRTFKDNQAGDSYNITFGQGTIDLSKTRFDEPATVDININFGSGILRLNPEVPTLVTANVTFGKVTFPNKEEISMGAYTFNSHPDATPIMVIQANVTFGSLEIESH